MSQSTLPITRKTTGERYRPIVVEMSTKQLPPRMRIGGFRSAIGLPRPGTYGVRRVLMAPIAMLARILGR